MSTAPQIQGAPILPLTPAVRHYDWGKRYDESIIARFYPESDRSGRLAELWYGAHPSAPGTVRLGTVELPLDELLRQHHLQLLGSQSVAYYGLELPFLLKVLSIGSALSIQAHPDKTRAAQLHRCDPAHYPDDNHKPEMAIALAPVSLLYGFRDREEISTKLRETPELSLLLRERLTDADALNRASTKDIYAAIMSASQDLVRASCAALIERLDAGGALSAEDDFVRRLSPRFSDGDVGLLCFYLLNLEELRPGEALFIPPNVPHAYLSGELVECMANSDNVVRGGLTPKFKDVPTLVEMLDYSVGRIRRLAAAEETEGGISLRRYTPPVQEFRLEELRGNGRGDAVRSESAEILLCVAGEITLFTAEATMSLGPGRAAFVSASTPRYSFSCKDSLVYRASVPLLQFAETV